jgi:hypothetical protein
VAGCAAGLGISVAARLLAHPLQQSASIPLTIRAAFIPVIAAIAFLASDPHQNLTAALPAPAWLTTAMRLVMALPLLGLVAWAQLDLAATEFSIGLRDQGLAAPHLPWLSFAAELTAWSAITLAAAALIARTRWNDLGGAIAAPAAIAFIALLAVTPLHLFPATISPLTPKLHSAWQQAEWKWWALALIAALITCWVSRDPWLRLRPAITRLAVQRNQSIV